MMYDMHVSSAFTTTSMRLIRNDADNLDDNSAQHAENGTVC